MIRMIYSQQNVFQLGVCPLLCALLTNSSMEQYGTLAHGCAAVCFHLCAYVCVCVCACGLFSAPIPTENLASHLEWTCFRNRTVSYSYCVSTITRILWEKPCFDLSMISVTCVLVLKKRYNYAETGPLFLFHWAASDVKFVKLICYVPRIRPKGTRFPIIYMEENMQGELHSHCKVNEAAKTMVSEKQRKNNVLQIAVWEH